MSPERVAASIEAYEKLKQKMALDAQISHIKHVLTWDRAVTMPRGAKLSRNKDMAVLSALMQEGMTNAEMSQWIEDAAFAELDEWDDRNLERIVEKYRHARMLPVEAVRDRAEKRERCFSEYEVAHKENDWKHVRPYFEESFAAYLRCAKIASDQLGISPYDYQLMRYSRTNSIATIDPLFNLLKEHIPLLLQKIISVQKDVQILPIQIGYDQQHNVAEKFITAMGYDFNHGHMALAPSAFSSGWRQDARIATRYEPGTIKTIFSAIHEAGHAIYKQNLPAKWEGQPVGGDSDVSLHESQSLFFEKQIGFSAPGLRLIHSLLVEEEPIFGRAYSADEFVTRMHHVRPGLVRIHADEVTYPLHIVLRYEIERDLFEENIRVADIPEIWRAKVKDYLGLDVPDDVSGCLQDRHWFKGKFGYFPVYAQGAMYAAQLFHTVRSRFEDTDQLIEDGNMRPITRWLNENIHRWGQFYEAPELLQRATGIPPSAEFLLDHLKARYLKLDG